MTIPVIKAKISHPGSIRVIKAELAPFGSIRVVKATLAKMGAAGNSAYEIAVLNGYEGTEEEWLESLIGKPAPSSDEGNTLTQGTDSLMYLGPDAYEEANAVQLHDTDAKHFSGTQEQDLADAKAHAESPHAYEPSGAVAEHDAASKHFIGTDKADLATAKNHADSPHNYDPAGTASSAVSAHDTDAKHFTGTDKQDLADAKELSSTALQELPASPAVWEMRSPTQVSELRSYSPETLVDIHLVLSEGGQDWYSNVNDYTPASVTLSANLTYFFEVNGDVSEWIYSLPDDVRGQNSIAYIYRTRVVLWGGGDGSEYTVATPPGLAVTEVGPFTVQMDVTSYIIIDIWQNRTGTYYDARYVGTPARAAHLHSLIETGNPHGTSKADIGLGSVNNTSDAEKPVSTAVQEALEGKADSAHSHDGVYDPVGTAAGAVEAHDTDAKHFIGTQKADLAAAKAHADSPHDYDLAGTASGAVSIHQLTYDHSRLADAAQRSELALVAFSGFYGDLLGVPIFNLHAVASSGDYNDLNNLPAIPSTPADIGAAAAGDLPAGMSLAEALEAIATTPRVITSVVLKGVVYAPKIGAVITDLTGLTLDQGVHDCTLNDGDVLSATPLAGGWIILNISGGSGVVTADAAIKWMNGTTVNDVVVGTELLLRSDGTTVRASVGVPNA